MSKVTANSYLESPLWGSWWLESRLSRVMPSADPCPLLTPALSWPLLAGVLAQWPVSYQCKSALGNLNVQQETSRKQSKGCAFCTGHTCLPCVSMSSVKKHRHQRSHPSLLGTNICKLSIFKRNEIRINSVPKLGLYFPMISLHVFLHESQPLRSRGDIIKVKSIWVKIKSLHI